MDIANNIGFQTGYIEVPEIVKEFNIITRLNIKILCIVVVLMAAVTAYSHWSYSEAKNAAIGSKLESITAFLVKHKPSGSFAEIAARQGAADQSVQEQVLAVNRELQPCLDNILVPTNIIKFGYYSRQQESVVAIGPQSDTSLLIGVDSDRYRRIYETNTAQFLERKQSIVWHGAAAITHVRPIEENGIVIGHAFAAVNQDAVYAMIWKRTFNIFLGAFAMMLACFAIFRDVFVKLKRELTLFAEAIFAGNACNFSSEIAELTPILQHINAQTEKMTRLDRLNIIGEMAAGIAHEIRNPMTTVRGLLQFLGKKQEFAKYREDFELMIDEIDRANSIITEFLSLAKNKAIELTENNLNEMIREIYPLLQADALRNNCEIHISFADTPNVLADQNCIRQLVLNMVRNGLDAMPGGGVIDISTEVADSKVLLSIRDHGIGISPEIKEKLGTPFFTTKEKGTGLGLAVCYRIVQRHGASITVESEPGQGTVFEIRFNPV
ncbi:MAG: ATP-binding protein [Veillonellales bacterium]